MSLNSHVQTPYAGDFTLESLGLSDKPENIDHLNGDGVLGYQTPNSPTAVIDTDATPNSQPTTSMTDTETAELPDWDVKVNLLNDNANKVINMSDVQKDIEDSGSMTQDKAQAIEATFEGFFDATTKPHHFTTFESKTGYDKAVKFMRDKIKVTTEALVTEFREAQAGSIGELARAIDTVREFCSEELRDVVNKAINEITAVQVNLFAGPIILPFRGDSFIDMTEVNLLTVDVDQIKQGVPVSEEFRLNFAKMKEIWGASIAVREAVFNMAGADADWPCDLQNLYIKTISRAFCVENSSVSMNAAIDTIDAIDENIQSRWNQAEEPLQPTTESLDVITTQAKELSSETDKITLLQKDMMDVAEFAKACAVVVLGIVSLR